MRCEGGGKPLVFELTPGQRHEAPIFEQLMEGGAIKQRGRGRPRRRPARVSADKAYSSPQIRWYVRRHRIGIVIPRKANEKHRGRFDAPAYRQRTVGERLFNRLKPFRRVATRYEKRGQNYLAMVTLAAILLWL